MNIFKKLFCRRVEIVKIGNYYYIKKGNSYLDNSTSSYSWFNTWWPSDYMHHGKFNSLNNAKYKWSLYNDDDAPNKPNKIQKIETLE